MHQPREILLSSWKDFPSAVEKIAGIREAMLPENRRHLKHPLFRGLGNADWALETTLERSADADRCC